MATRTAPLRSKSGSTRRPGSTSPTGIAHGSQPASARGSQPSSARGSQPASARGSQAVSPRGSQPASARGSQPASARGPQLPLSARRRNSSGRVQHLEASRSDGVALFAQRAREARAETDGAVADLQEALSSPRHKSSHKDLRDLAARVRGTSAEDGARVLLKEATMRATALEAEEGIHNAIAARRTSAIRRGIEAVDLLSPRAAGGPPVDEVMLHKARIELEHSQARDEVTAAFRRGFEGAATPELMAEVQRGLHKAGRVPGLDPALVQDARLRAVAMAAEIELQATLEQRSVYALKEALQTAERVPGVDAGVLARARERLVALRLEKSLTTAMHSKSLTSLEQGLRDASAARGVCGNLLEGAEKVRQSLETEEVIRFLMERPPSECDHEVVEDALELARLAEEHNPSMRVLLREADARCGVARVERALRERLESGSAADLEEALRLAEASTRQSAAIRPELLARGRARLVVLQAEEALKDATSRQDLVSLNHAIQNAKAAEAASRRWPGTAAEPVAEVSSDVWRAATRQKLSLELFELPINSHPIVFSDISTRLRLFDEVHGYAANTAPAVA